MVMKMKLQVWLHLQLPQSSLQLQLQQIVLKKVHPLQVALFQHGASVVCSQLLCLQKVSKCCGQQRQVAMLTRFQKLCPPAYYL